jgi:hypothetical protein
MWGEKLARRKFVKIFKCFNWLLKIEKFCRICMFFMCVMCLVVIHIVLSFFLLFHFFFFESRFKLLLIFPNQSTRINTRTQDYTFQLLCVDFFSSWNILWVFFHKFPRSIFLSREINFFYHPTKKWSFKERRIFLILLFMLW